MNMIEWALAADRAHALARRRASPAEGACKEGLSVFLSALAVLLLVAAMLAGCTPPPPTSILPPPATAANATVIDEHAMIVVEEGYRAAGALIEAATDGGLLKGAAAARVDDLDGKAAIAIGALEQAYAAGNAADYASALTAAQRAVAQLTTLVKRHGDPAPGGVQP